MRRGLALGALLLAWGWGVRAGAQAAAPALAPTAVPAPASPARAGIAAFKSGHLAEAKPLLGKAVALDPADAAARANLGLVLLGLDRDLDGAREQLEAAVRLEPASARYHQWLGTVYSAQAGASSVPKAPGLAKRARQEFEKAVELDPADPDARLALLQFYLSAPGIAGGSVDRAREQALAMTAIDRYRGLLAQALIAEHEKEPDRAEQLYRSAIAAFPDQGDAYNQLGYLLLGAKRRDEAIAMFRAYVAARPADANPHDSLAEGLLADGKVDESIAEYRRALEIDTGFSSSYLGLAACYERKGSWPEARAALEQFLRLVPAGPRADAARDRLETLEKKVR